MLLFTHICFDLLLFTRVCLTRCCLLTFVLMLLFTHVCFDFLSFTPCLFCPIVQDVLVQQQSNVSVVFQCQVQSFEDNFHHSDTPTNIEDIVEQEFSCRFHFPASLDPYSMSPSTACMPTPVGAHWLCLSLIIISSFNLRNTVWKNTRHIYIYIYTYIYLLFFRWKKKCILIVKRKRII